MNGKSGGVYDWFHPNKIRWLILLHGEAAQSQQISRGVEECETNKRNAELIW